jgi:23S rRNA (pseudouridine1915-N3)-methyltransferase
VHIYLIALGQKMPVWVEKACNEYIKRLPRELQFDAIEVPIIRRGKNPDIQRIVRDESRKAMASVPPDCFTIALDVTGKKISTEALAQNLDNWMQQGQDIAIVIGGPDGLSDELLKQVDRSLSLSDMTFPHPLVRIIIIEQLYRAWSIISNHPYHRA